MVIGAGGLGHIGIQCLKALTPTEIIVVERSPDQIAKRRGRKVGSKGERSRGARLPSLQVWPVQQHFVFGANTFVGR